MHTPGDSLRYLMASDAAGDVIDILSDEGNPRAIERAIAILEKLRREIRHEARLCGVEGIARYSTNVPVLTQREEAYLQPAEDGVTCLVTRPVIRNPYPADGGDWHPVCRRGEGAFA